VEKLGGLAERWRYLVVGVEVLVAVACLFFGLKMLAPPAFQPPVQVLRAPTRPPQPGVGLGLPPGQPATARKPVLPHTSLVPGLTSDALSRVNRDDFELYRRQWQVLQMLMDGVRTYLEHRVAPQLLSR
jgi:hypothetical protein